MGIIEQLISWKIQKIGKDSFISIKDYISGVRNQIFSSLTPDLNVDIVKDYKPALDFALRKSPDNTIRNIAITGGYGSGKSSIIGTYFNNHNSLNYKYLSVSLASFSEEFSLTHPVEQNEENKKERLRQIELSILQQIFYSEDSKNVPESNIKRIKTLKSWVRLFYSICSLIFLTYFFNSLFHKFFFSIEYDFILDGLSKINLENNLNYYKKFIISCILLMGIYKSIGFLFKLKISSFKFKDTELKFEENNNKSFFNQYIDEIIYFFESTKKNVLIIEDLDRFQQTEIFIKLREINLLINQSKKIKSAVFFIYAVRDEIFKFELERTKFFDFIIPVIPVINPSNSIDILKKKSKEIGANFSDDLLDSIAIFIGDMRLLHNVINEFIIFRSKLQGEIKDDKLLAIIIYKNLNPSDFTDLLHRRGILFNLLHSRGSIIASKKKKIILKIQKNEEMIQKSESDYLKEISDLRRIYISRYFEDNNGLVSLKINGLDKSIKNIIESENFYSDLNSNLIGIYHNKHYSNLETISLKRISDIEKEINEIGYLEREAFIKNTSKKKINILKIQLSVLRSKIKNLEQESISNLLDRTEFNLLSLTINDNLKNLIYILVKNNYLAEDYIYYISHFYDESLTRGDYEFLLSVKSGKSYEFFYALSNLPILIRKFNISDFKTTEILNIDLLEYMLETSLNKNQSDDFEIKIIALFNTLKSKNKKCIDFIFQFLDETKFKKEFINYLFASWKDGWSKLIQNIDVNRSDEINILFQDIIVYLDPEKFQKFQEDYEFFIKFTDDPRFLEYNQDIKRSIDIIENLKPTFYKLDYDSKHSSAYDFILNNSFYYPTINMIELFLRNANKFNESNFKYKNYTTILESDINLLMKNIETNFFNYLNNEYLELANPQSEDEENLLKIYNSEAFNRDLNEDSRQKIITKSLTLVSDISLIDNHSYKLQLLENKKVIPTWANLYNIFKNIPESIDGIVIYLNNLNSEELLNLGESNSQGDEIFRNLIIGILQNTKLELKIFNEITIRLEFDYSLLDLRSINREKLEFLIDCKNLSLNSQVYESLIEINQEYVIKFIFNHKVDFLQNRSLYPIGIKLFPHLLIDDNWSDQDIQIFIQELPEQEILSDLESTKTIYNLLINRHELTITFTLLKNLLASNHLTNEESMNLFTLKINLIGIEHFEDILSRYGNDIVKLLLPNENVELTKNSYTENLINALRDLLLFKEVEYKRTKIQIQTKNLNQ